MLNLAGIGEKRIANIESLIELITLIHKYISHLLYLMGLPDSIVPLSASIAVFEEASVTNLMKP